MRELSFAVGIRGKVNCFHRCATRTAVTGEMAITVLRPENSSENVKHKTDHKIQNADHEAYSANYDYAFADGAAPAAAD